MQAVLWHALANRSGRDDADRSAGSSPWTEGIRHGGVRARDVICIPARTSEGVQNSVLDVNLVSVLDCSVLNWVEQKELRGLASDERLFGRIAEPGWMLMDFNNIFKCRMGRLSEKFVKREGVSRGHDVTIDARCEHDVIGQFPGRYFGHEGKISAIRRYPV